MSDTDSLPAYVEFGGLGSAPGPLQCDDTTLYVFGLQADHAKMDALCQRVFNTPTGGAVDGFAVEALSRFREEAGLFSMSTVVGEDQQDVVKGIAPIRSPRSNELLGAVMAAVIWWAAS